MSWVKDYLTFSKKERNGFIALIALMVIFLFLPDFFAPKKVTGTISPEVKEKMNALSPSKEDAPGRESTSNRGIEAKSVSLFHFNPNTIDEEGLIRLGLHPRTARTIMNYRNKGGKFRDAEDMRKIYTLSKEEADRIIPYARVPKEEYGYNNNRNYYQGQYTRKPYTIAPIDINTASLEEWKSLPGIGDAYSARIIKYRERLGGFASIDQVAKTYNLPDSTFQKMLPYLRLANPAFNKININQAYETDLMECPAMTTDLAKAIIIYRRQHGNYQSVEDLKKIVFVTDELYEKVASCLRVD